MNSCTTSRVSPNFERKIVPFSSLLTSDLSIYSRLDNGNISLIKPPAFEVHFYDALVFVPDFDTIRALFSNLGNQRFKGYSSKDYLDYLHGYMNSSNPNRDCFITNTRDSVLRYIPSEPVRGGLFLSFWNMINNNVDFRLPVSVNPFTGYYPFCQKRIDSSGSSSRIKHFGTDILEID